MGFFKNIAKSLGLSAKKEKDSIFNEEKSNRIASFDTLIVGDFVEFGATDIMILSGKSSEVNNVKLYKDVIGNIVRREYETSCGSFNIQLTRDCTNSNNVIISKRETTGAVLSVLKENDIGDLIESDLSDNVVIRSKKKNHNNEWYGKKYRKGKFEQENINDQEVDYHLLVDDDGVHVLQLYVFPDRTEVYTGFTYPKESLIKDIFAAS